MSGKSEPAAAVGDNKNGERPGAFAVSGKCASQEGAKMLTRHDTTFVLVEIAFARSKYAAL